MRVGGRSQCRFACPEFRASFQKPPKAFQGQKTSLPNCLPMWDPSSQSLQEERVTKQRFQGLPSLSRDSYPEGRGWKGDGCTLHMSHPVPQEKGSRQSPGVTLEEGVLTSHQGITLILGIGNSGMELRSKLQSPLDQTLWNP